MLCDARHSIPLIDVNLRCQLKTLGNKALVHVCLPHILTQIVRIKAFCTSVSELYNPYALPQQSRSAGHACLEQLSPALALLPGVLLHLHLKLSL